MTNDSHLMTQLYKFGENITPYKGGENRSFLVFHRNISQLRFATSPSVVRRVVVQSVVAAHCLRAAWTDARTRPFNAASRVFLWCLSQRDVSREAI